MNARIPSPLVGFNNNVRYRGMSFHIQTEDSGLGRPHIITHLFADGGRVIKTLRLDYSEHVEHPDYRTIVHRMMREQHKAMAYELRRGKVDAIIDTLMLRPSVRDELRRSLRPTGASAAPPAALSPAALSPAALSPAEAPAAPPPAEAPAAAPLIAEAPPLAAANAPASERPAPSRSGVFIAVPSESLDELILGYVSSGRR